MTKHITADPFMYAARRGYPRPTNIIGEPMSPAEDPTRKCDWCQRVVPYGVMMSQRMCPGCWAAR